MHGFGVSRRRRRVRNAMAPPVPSATHFGQPANGALIALFFGDF